jgi:hypothetical protein
LLAYLCFPQGFQLWGDRAGTRGSDCTVFAVTENLVKITVRLNGAIICWPEGITLKSGCDDSPARLQLYQQLLENNLKARSFAQTFESAYAQQRVSLRSVAVRPFQARHDQRRAGVL